MPKFALILGLLCISLGASAVVVKPTFTSTPPLTASQGVLYTYTVSASTPDHETVTFTLHGPAGATLIGGDTVNWTPTAVESRHTNSFSITATSASGGKATQSFKIVPTGTVTGTRIDHYLKGVTVPENLSTLSVAAYVPNGTGGYNVIPGTGTSSGTFTINGVPGGFYLLAVGRMYLWTQNSTVHFDSFADTRPSPAQADPSTSLTFDLTNVNAWQIDDSLEMFAPNNAAFQSFSEANGLTTFTGNFAYFGALSNAALGDQYYVTQLITQPVGGFDWSALGRYLALPEFTQANGSDTSINGALKTIAQTQQFEANINGADITQAANAVNPSGAVTDTSVFLDAFPGSLANGAATASPDLAGYSLGNGLPFLNSNADLGPVTYGNPFPVSWPLFAGYVWSVSVPYTAPGATTSTNLFGSVFGFTETLPTKTQPLALMISGAANATVNGSNFFSNLSGIGLTPKLSWVAPVVGKASYYQVNVWKLSKNGTGSAVQLISTLQTPTTSITLPPGLLVSGTAYVFELYAYDVAGFNPSFPLKLSKQYGAADEFSGVMQP